MSVEKGRKEKKQLLQRHEEEGKWHWRWEDWKMGKALRILGTLRYGSQAGRTIEATSARLAQPKKQKGTRSH